MYHGDGAGGGSGGWVHFQAALCSVRICTRLAFWDGLPRWSWVRVAIVAPRFVFDAALTLAVSYWSPLTPSRISEIGSSTLFAYLLHRCFQPMITELIDFFSLPVILLFQAFIAQPPSARLLRAARRRLAGAASPEDDECTWRDLVHPIPLFAAMLLAAFIAWVAGGADTSIGTF